MFSNIKAGGVGLSGKGCSNVATIELWWNPGTHSQMEDRFYGQHRGVEGKSTVCWYLIAADTIESRKLKIIADRQSVLDQVLDGKLEGERTDFSVFDELLQEMQRSRR